LRIIHLKWLFFESFSKVLLDYDEISTVFRSIILRLQSCIAMSPLLPEDREISWGIMYHTLEPPPAISEWIDVMDVDLNPAKRGLLPVRSVKCDSYQIQVVIEKYEIDT